MAYAIPSSAGWTELVSGTPFRTQDGTQFPANWLEHASTADIAAIGGAAITEPPAAPDGKVNQVTGLVDQGGVPVRAYVVVDVSVPSPADLQAYASTARDLRRDSGITLSGMAIKTDLVSQNLIAGAYQISQAKPDQSIDFKTATGWVSLDAATMQTIALAVGSWVQACYTAEKAIDAQITAGTITTTAQIDAAFAAVALPTT